MNFGKVWRAQLPKTTLLTSTLVSLGSFQVCSDAKERVGCGKQREATAPIQSLVKLQPWFLSLWWKTCLRLNCSLGSCTCSEGPALGQNTLMMILTLTTKEKKNYHIIIYYCNDKEENFTHHYIRCSKFNFIALHAHAFQIPACCPKRIRDLLGEFCKKYTTSSNFSSVKTSFTFSYLSIKMPSICTFFTKLKIVTFEGICTPVYLHQNFLLRTL